MKKTLYKPIILFIDDDVFMLQHSAEILGRYIPDYHIEIIDNIDNATTFLKKYKNQIKTIVLDIMMPPGKAFSNLETHGGFSTGLIFAKTSKR